MKQKKGYQFRTAVLVLIMVFMISALGQDSFLNNYERQLEDDLLTTIHIVCHSHMEVGFQ